LNIEYQGIRYIMFIFAEVYAVVIRDGHFCPPRRAGGQKRAGGQRIQKRQEGRRAGGQRKCPQDIPNHELKTAVYIDYPL